MSAGKGDKPRSCFSRQYKDNYAKIKWKKSDSIVSKKTVRKKGKIITTY